MNSLALLNCSYIIQRNVLTYLLGISSEILVLFKLIARTLINFKRGKFSFNYHNYIVKNVSAPNFVMIQRLREFKVRCKYSMLQIF